MAKQTAGNNQILRNAKNLFRASTYKDLSEMVNEAGEGFALNWITTGIPQQAAAQEVLRTEYKTLAELEAAYVACQLPAPTQPVATQADSAQTDGERDAVVTNKDALAMHEFLKSRKNATYAEMCAALHADEIYPDTVSKLIDVLTKRGVIEYDGTRWEHDVFATTWRVTVDGSRQMGLLAILQENEKFYEQQPQATQPTASAGVDAVGGYDAMVNADGMIELAVQLEDAQTALEDMRTENARLSAQVATLTAALDVANAKIKRMKKTANLDDGYIDFLEAKRED